ncbi:hypothetical protein [Tenacibaculum haliotis]|uniref:hypothetical protein n=1 Tax=Tenacibaculum haliotis TaxID=1888914 RepID=UPI0021AF57B3|nr:hypothetical protein [Tenacibaculum haliotis]MCT4698470.1 hypothetical protein [Tenacibaculum haliotis]
MKHLLLILLFIPFLSVAQIHQGNVFKSVPTSPTESVKLTGVIEVSKTMYGVTFKDTRIAKQYKNAVKTFFKKRLNGYTDLKKYRLQVKKRTDGLYIENIKILVY